MTRYEIDIALRDMKIIADTREQDTPAFRKRFAGSGLTIVRNKLDFGDYTAVTEIDGKVYSLENVAVVERKMSLDELAMCFGKERARFQREFERSSAAGARVYLLVENATWENLLAGRYRSKLKPESFFASLLAWTARYNIVPVFCKADISGKVIAGILRYELRERLAKLIDE